MAIIRAQSASLNPSMEVSSPNEAMMAPPGIPGAATMVMPSMKIKPVNISKSYGMPVANISATEQATIFITEPDMCMVAQRGTVKPAVSGATPIFMVWRSVTGIVAADDCVPRAVK